MTPEMILVFIYTIAVEIIFPMGVLLIILFSVAWVFEKVCSIIKDTWLKLVYASVRS